MIRLHNLPRREIERDVAIVQLLRDKKTQPDYLIRDVWSIVCLYLFGGFRELIVSVPFGSLIYNGNWLFRWTKYISCFYGVEDTNGGFDLIIDGQQVSVSGRYPLRRCDFDNGKSFQIDKRDLGQRAVLKLSFVHEKQKVVEKWFTWHWSGSKTFYSLEQANLSRTYRSMIPIFHTKNGHFDVFHPGYNENTIRILPTDEFHDCLRSSYHQCLQVHHRPDENM